MLLSVLDSHLDEEPHDKADQGCFNQRKQPRTFAPIKSKALVDASTKLNHSVADGVLFTVPKHVDAHHGCKPIAELPKHHAEHHRVSEQGFVGEEFNGMVGPLLGLVFPLFDANMRREDAGGEAG